MGKRIKILYTIPNFDTAGSGKVVYDLVKGLDRSIFEPEICCFHSRGKFYSEIEKLNLKIHLFRFATPYRPFLTLPFRVLKIRRFFKKNRFDIIHSWHWSSDFTEPLGARLAGIPFVYTKKAMGWGNKAWIWRSKLSTKIIAINSDMMSQFFKTMTHKTVQMPLGVDTEDYKPGLERDLSLSKLQLNQDDFIIVSVANLVAVKGIEILIKAVNELNDAAVKVLIIGSDDNEYGEMLKSTYQSDSIEFLGKKEDVRPYLALADVFVIPTKDEGRKEGMPIAPLEAMASGRIVLGSRISGIKDILAPFENCLFEPSNTRKLSEKIKLIKGMSISEREALANAMRAHVLQNLSIEKCITDHEDLYKTLVEPKKALNQSK